MPLTTYPLNNVDYSAEDAELYNCTRTSGVYSGGDFSCVVSGADTNITINPGVGWIRNTQFRGKVVALMESMVLNLGVSNATYPRIDAVVIQFDINSNQTDIVVKNGTAATSPLPPEVVQTESLYELHLYHVYRAAGSTVVSAADVTDLRLSPEYCGLMADSVTSIDTSAIRAQIDALILDLKAKIAAAEQGSYLPLSGGTVNGSLTLGGNLILTEGVNLFASEADLPADAPEGALYWVLPEEAEA